ncbi:hypothetical protein HDE_12624 [Halotydeus destructor]|nr:hypothetical protein HDE_12624 [Halotydeus destructor]
MLLLLLLLRSWWWRWQAKVLAAARSLVKGFLRRTTGLCELQRIVYGSRDGRQACLALDQSLAASRCPPVRRAVLQLLLQLSLQGDQDWQDREEEEEEDRGEWAQLERACEAICAAKAVGAAQRAHLVAKGLRPCLAHMAAYQRLVLAVKRLRATPFEPQLHLELLQPLWQSTTTGDPAGPLRRPSGRWTAQCGFGSPDPVAELSGEAGALLGLLHINFLLANYDGGGWPWWQLELPAGQHGAPGVGAGVAPAGRRPPQGPPLWQSSTAGAGAGALGVRVRHGEPGAAVAPPPAARRTGGGQPAAAAPPAGPRAAGHHRLRAPARAPPHRPVASMNRQTHTHRMFLEQRVY